MKGNENGVMVQEVWVRAMGNETSSERILIMQLSPITEGLAMDAQ
jgi:hypothetical protein